MVDSKVDEYLSTLEPNEQQLVSYLRSFVPGINPEIREQVKWNSLAFFKLNTN